jgi:predicted outer membrane repeat protein
MRNSSPYLEQVVITNNSTQGRNQRGGGIHCVGSNPTLVDVTVIRNTAVSGGGIYADHSELTLSNVTVAGNAVHGMVTHGYIDGVGGGLLSECSTLLLENVTICKNSADWAGGGICLGDSSAVITDPDRPSSIYLNQAMLGSDLFAGIDSPLTTIPVSVDTFTVMEPTETHAFPRESFTFDILHAKAEPVEADLYVSPYGKEANSGLSPADPLRTISLALAKVKADSLHPRTIYLANGIYSRASNGEVYPISISSHLSLQGESANGVILDAEGVTGVLIFHQVNESTISSLTITGGQTFQDGGGIHCYRSDPVIQNVIVTGNVALGQGGMGGGRGDGGGIIYCERSNMRLANTTVGWNWPNGISCVKGSLVNTIIYDGIDGDSVHVIYSNIQGGWEGEGNIDADPLFADTISGNYSLQAGSPCIDAGTAFYVWKGDTLINLSPDDYIGLAPDIGALEYGAVTSLAGISSLPFQFTLQQNYPNPFNPVSTIRYDLPKGSDVSLIVYDILGREVARLVDGTMEPGYHEVQWDGREYASGMYIVRLITPVYTKSIKMVLMK